MRRNWMLSACLTMMCALSAAAPAQTSAAAKHPFDGKDFASLRSAEAMAVSPDGMILYVVTFGGDTGPTHKEWWTIAADGTHVTKLNLPEDFSPMGFTRDGHSLYGAWKINNLPQLAIFALQNGKTGAVPSTVALLPRGIESALPNPQGTQYAIVADPRPPDPLDSVRHVQEPDETSIYVVQADGTGGKWWCSELKYVSAGIEGGGEGALAWSTDGQSLAALSVLPRIGHHDVGTDINVCSASGTHHVTRVPNTVSGIAWASSGHEIAFISTKTAVLTPEHVWTVSASGGDAEDRTPNLGGTTMALAGNVRGQIWVLLERGVRNEVDEYVDGTLKPAYRWPDGVLAGPPVSSLYGGTSDQIALT